MGKDFTVTIHNLEREAEWREVLGTATVHVNLPFPHGGDLPGRPGAVMYELDVALLTPEQKRRLIEHLSQKFGEPRDFVARMIEGEHGVPILAEDCTLTVHNPQRWVA